MPYQGKWICCLRPVKNMYLNKKTCGFLGSLYDNFTTPFSNCISNIRKEVSRFTILPQGQMGEAMDCNRSLDSLNDSLIYPQSIWRPIISHKDLLRNLNSVIIMQKKKSLSHHIPIYVPFRAVKQLCIGVYCTKNCFSYTVGEFLKDYSLERYFSNVASAT